MADDDEPETMGVDAPETQAPPSGVAGLNFVKPQLSKPQLSKPEIAKLEFAKPHMVLSPGRAAIRTMLEREATKAGLPPDIAEAVVQVESSFNPNVIGSVGEIGLMQVRPSTAAMLGFRGTPDDLAQPENNIHYGVTYLAKAWRIAGGDLCRALMKYRAGHGEETMSPLSVRYCERARSHLAAIGSTYAGPGTLLTAAVAALPVVSSAAPAPAVAKPAASLAPKAVYAKFRRGTAMASKVYWQAHETRVRAITAKLRAKWHRVASR